MTTVYDLLSDASRWTQKFFARNDLGYPVSYNSTSACSFCLAGAILKCYCGEQYVEVMSKVDQYINTNYNMKLTDFNDNGTHEQILALAKELGI